MTMHCRVEETKGASALGAAPIRWAHTHEGRTTSQRLIPLAAHPSEIDITLSAIVAETRNKTCKFT